MVRTNSPKPRGTIRTKAKQLHSPAQAREAAIPAIGFHERVFGFSAACQQISAKPKNPSTNPYGLASYAYQYASVVIGKSRAMKPANAPERIETKRYRHRQNIQNPRIS